MTWQTSFLVLVICFYLTIGIIMATLMWNYHGEKMTPFKRVLSCVLVVFFWPGLYLL